MKLKRSIPLLLTSIILLLEIAIFISHLADQTTTKATYGRIAMPNRSLKLTFISLLSEVILYLIYRV